MFEKSTMDARQGDKTHQCIAGRSCRGYTIGDNDERQPALTEQPDTLCDTCAGTFSSAIKRLFKDHAMLAATLGERRSRTGETVASTPSPVVLLDTTSDRLMTEIVEWADYAANVITHALHTRQTHGARKLPTQIHLEELGTIELEADSVAERTWKNTRPDAATRLSAYLAAIEPNINLLAGQATRSIEIWSQPQRCPQHSDQIIEAKRLLDLARGINDPAETEEAHNQLQAAYTSAGVCNTCCGWSEDGRSQARQEIELSGLDVLNRLTRLHHLTRKHLGHTRLRHYYPMPCPRCGAPVGRDDGTTILNCENEECTPRGPSSWTEREYEYLTRLMTDDEAALKTTKYLLAEAYSRLDGLQRVVNKLADDPALDAPGAGRIILEHLTTQLSGHATANDRRIATDKAAAQQRQVDEDNWAWSRTKPYKKPPRKPAPEPRTDIPKIAVSSRSLMTDDGGLYPDEYVVRSICSTCHLTKPCDCEA